ncbi:unnamed protein product [Durusdinium trenchii]|uniref:Uncharacterized protein n=1 Tax=Durusdinium trenchii TaxID=1381693 RepID=A0ABP0QBP8_9DINO
MATTLLAAEKQELADKAATVPLVSDRETHETEAKEKEVDLETIKDATPEEREQKCELWLEKYAPDGPYIQETTETEKAIKAEHPEYDLEGALKKHADFAAYFLDLTEFMQEQLEKEVELDELFKRFHALDGDPEELKAKKQKWSDKRAEKLAKLAALRG